jgi:hypothetical protein
VNPQDEREPAESDTAVPAGFQGVLNYLYQLREGYPPETPPFRHLYQPIDDFHSRRKKIPEELYRLAMGRRVAGKNQAFDFSDIAVIARRRNEPMIASHQLYGLQQMKACNIVSAPHFP